MTVEDLQLLMFFSTVSGSSCFDICMISTQINTHLPFRNYSTSSEVPQNHIDYVCKLSEQFVQARSWGGGPGGQCPPPTRNRIEIMPHQNKICSCRFQLFLPKLQILWFTLKWQCPFSRKNYQYGCICHGSYVNMCMENKVFVVVKFTYN